jgi:hypothetical protein
MADHVRKQLRAALATRLTGLTTTATRVHGHRVDPLQVGALPALVISCRGDDAETITVHAPALYERAVRVFIHGMVAAGSVPEDTLDQIGKEVEIALATPLTVDGRSVQLWYQRSEMTYEAGEQVAGQIEIEYLARLHTAADAPDVLS